MWYFLSWCSSMSWVIWWRCWLLRRRLHRCVEQLSIRRGIIRRPLDHLLAQSAQFDFQLAYLVRFLVLLILYLDLQSGAPLLFVAMLRIDCSVASSAVIEVDDWLALRGRGSLPVANVQYPVLIFLNSIIFVLARMAIKIVLDSVRYSIGDLKHILIAFLAIAAHCLDIFGRCYDPWLEDFVCESIWN